MNPQINDPYSKNQLTDVFLRFLPKLRESLKDGMGPWLQGRKSVARHGTCGRVLYWSFWDSRQKSLGIDPVYFTYAVSYDPVRFELRRHDWAVVLHLNTVRSYYGTFPLRTFLAERMPAVVPSGFQWEEHPRFFRVIQEFSFFGAAEDFPKKVSKPVKTLVEATHPVLEELFAAIKDSEAHGPRRAGEGAKRERARGSVANPNREGVKSELNRAITARMRAMVLERFGWRCHLCNGVIPDKTELHIDHLVPWAVGGKTTLDNLRPAHVVCNLAKGAGGKMIAPELRSPAKRRPGWKKNSQLP